MNIKAIAAVNGFKVKVHGQPDPLPVAVWALEGERIIPMVINPVGAGKELIAAEKIDPHNPIQLVAP